MNLRGIANGATRAINPNIAATVSVSAGYDHQSGRKRVPKFDQLPFSAQVQALQYNDMVHLDGLNIQGIRRAIYLNGTIDSVKRINKQGRRYRSRSQTGAERGIVAGRARARAMGRLVQSRRDAAG